MLPTCDLCAAADPAGATGGLMAHFPDGSSPVVARTPHAIAVPTIGAFVPGYLLVVPLTHSTSIGRLPPHERHGVRVLTDQLADRLAALYASPVLGFEYGLNVARGRRVEHGHQHLLPSRIGPALRDYLDRRLPLVQVDSLEHLPSDDRRSYISVYEPGRPVSVYPVPNDASPRIRMREVIAHLDPRVFANSWDWQTHPCTDLMRTTVTDLTRTTLSDARRA
jgi:diadenosine tetraphosphate (Ap4A) HIT family hydrolase